MPDQDYTSVDINLIKISPNHIHKMEEVAFYKIKKIDLYGNEMKKLAPLGRMQTPNFKFLIPVALILIPSFLGLFYGLATFIFYKFGLKTLLSSFFLFSLLFGLVEFLRGNILTGFPLLFKYSFASITECFP